MFLHITGIVLIIMTPMLITSKDIEWLCSSTIGCTMKIGPNNTHYASMNALCNIVGDNMDFSCSGSRRCCSNCRLPLTFSMAEGSPVHVTAHDELHGFFYICVWIMGGVLAFELMIGIIVACSKHAKKDTVSSYEETSQLIVNWDKLPSMDMVTKAKGSVSRWRLVIMLCRLSGSLVLVTEISLLVAMVLIPAVPHIKSLSCFIYVILYFITALAVYTCVALIVERYIISSKEMDKEHACMKTCLCKNILSVMGLLMWLVIIGGLVTASIYCIIIAMSNK